MRKSKIICLDIETTGLDIMQDEILQVSIINGRGRTLYNSYIRPERKREWKDAEKINKISWQAVRNAPSLKHEKKKIERILQKAGLIVGYNHKAFDLPFMAARGINTAVKAEIYDVMLEFSYIAGEYDEEQRYIVILQYAGTKEGAGQHREERRRCMNKRQRKKKFKRRYGYNPPQSMPIHKAEQIAAVIEQYKMAWECLKNTLLEIVKVLQPHFERMVIPEHFTDTRFKKIEKLQQAWQEEHKKENEEVERWKQFTQQKKQ